MTDTDLDNFFTANESVDDILEETEEEDFVHKEDLEDLEEVVDESPAGVYGYEELGARPIN